MAVREVMKARWFTSAGSEYSDRLLAFKADVEELASEVRKEVTLSNARELRDALNAYLDQLTPQSDLPVNLDELRLRLLKHAVDITDPMYKLALGALRGALQYTTLAHLQTKLDTWQFDGDPERTRNWRNWVMGHATFIANKTNKSSEPIKPDKPVTNGRTATALNKVILERERQAMLKNTGRIPFTCADDGVDAGRRLAVLVEEVGEVAREICDGNTTTLETQHKLKTELVQVAAVAVAWVEFLDRLT
jgi:NTP pyrophosphatase (non-canonical NTP hydrolase)